MAIEIEQPSSVGLSKIANSETHGEDSPYFAGWKAYDENPYDESDNPTGVIQMGLAENQVSIYIARKWKRKFILYIYFHLAKNYNQEIIISNLQVYINLVYFSSIHQLQVSFDLLEEYLAKHSEATSWGKTTSSFKENALFQDYHGLQSFRKVTVFPP